MGYGLHQHCVLKFGNVHNALQMCIGGFLLLEQIKVE